MTTPSVCEDVKILSSGIMIGICTCNYNILPVLKTVQFDEASVEVK